MLVIVLAFGMAVVGCEEEKKDDSTEESKDTTPAAPTGLSGTVDGNSVQLTWQAVENASVYSLEFKKNSEFSSEYQAVNNLTSTSYTVTGLDANTTYNFRVAAQNAQGEKSGYSSVFTIQTSNPKTGTVFIKSLTTTHSARTMPTIDGPVENHGYAITLELALSDGALWVWELDDRDTVAPLLREWVTLTPPAGFSFDSTSVGSGRRAVVLVRYQSLTNSSALAQPNLTASIDQNKLSEMKGYTNVTDSLTLGTPSTASSNAWVDN